MTTRRRVLALLAPLVVLALMLAFTVTAFAADRYAILPASTTSNWNSTGTWSATSGGATGASVPTSADAVFVDALSVAGAAAKLQVVGACSALSMDWTGATNTPDFLWNANAYLQMYGNVTFIAAMTMTGTGLYGLLWQASGTLWTNGLVVTTNHICLAIGIDLKRRNKPKSR